MPPMVNHRVYYVSGRREIRRLSKSIVTKYRKSSVMQMRKKLLLSKQSKVEGK